MFGILFGVVAQFDGQFVVGLVVSGTTEGAGDGIDGGGISNHFEVGFW